MNQHNIQKAYLKNFESNGKIWVFNKEKETYVPRPASQCSSEEDFQSVDLETFQNKEIENPGIMGLRNLANKKHLDEKQRKIILSWTVLHNLRNNKFKNLVKFKSEQDFIERLNQDIKYSHNYYKHNYIYNCENNDFFVTSDNPIIDFNIENDVVRVFVWSPKIAFLFSPVEDFPSHSEIRIPDLINACYYHTSYKELFSKYKELPIEKYKQIIKEFEFAHTFNARNTNIYKKSLTRQ